MKLVYRVKYVGEETIGMLEKKTYKHMYEFYLATSNLERQRVIDIALSEGNLSAYEVLKKWLSDDVEYVYIGQSNPMPVEKRDIKLWNVAELKEA